METTQTPELEFKRNFYCKKPCETFIHTADYHENEEGRWVTICPNCGVSVPISNYRRNLHVSEHPGPTSAEGKAASAKNLDGERGQFNTEAARDRASQNAYKHGMYSQQPQLLAPAKPGKYPMCDGCELIDECLGGFKFCPKNMEPALKYLKAYKEGNHTELKDLAGLTQAQMFSMLQMSFQDVFEKGTLVLDQYFHKDGELAKELYKANPVMGKIIDMMVSLGFTADQQEMTPKASDEADVLKGSLEKGTVSTNEMISRIEASNKGVQEAIIAAAANRSNDEALNEFKAEQGES